MLAESEIINHVSEGVTVENILRGIHNSLADRALSLLKRVGLDGPVAFIGGVARQEGMVVALRDKLGVPVNVPDGPQFTPRSAPPCSGCSATARCSAPAAA